VIITKHSLTALTDHQFNALKRLVVNEARGRAQRTTVAHTLAQMAVGQWKLFAWNDASRLTTYRKVAARNILNDPDANWSARTTPKGVRVTRVK